MTKDVHYKSLYMYICSFAIAKAPFGIASGEPKSASWRAKSSVA